MTPEEEYVRSLLPEEEIEALKQIYEEHTKDLSPEDLEKFQKSINDLYNEMVKD